MLVKREKTVPKTFQLKPSLIARLQKATRKDGRWPPPPTKTDLVSRGIEMALQELERKK